MATQRIREVTFYVEERGASDLALVFLHKWEIRAMEQRPTCEGLIFEPWPDALSGSQIFRGE